MSCTHETDVVDFRVGFPVKDSQGNAIDTPEGIQLEVQYPGTTDFVIAGSVEFPNDTIQWKAGPDGKYIFRARCYLYAVKGPGGCGNACKRFGPASANIGVTVKNARPGSPPNPVEMVTCCGADMPSGGMVAPTLCCK